MFTATVAERTLRARSTNAAPLRSELTTTTRHRRVAGACLYTAMPRTAERLHRSLDVRVEGVLARLLPEVIRAI